MSFSETLKNHVDSVVMEYIKSLSKKFNLEEKELLSLWNSSYEEEKSSRKTVKKRVVQKPDLTDVDMTDLSRERLLKCNKAELTALCKSKGVKCSGTKDELLNRLLGEEPAKTNSKTKASAKAPAKKVEKKQAPIIEKLNQSKPVFMVRKNNKGNYEHPETGLLFDNKTQEAYGKQEEDGTVSDLNEEDIETCKKFKFSYRLPVNLDKKANLNDSKLDGIDDEDIDDVENDVEDEDVEEEEVEEEVEDEIEE